MQKKILVIDDEQPTLTMFRLFLEAFGYTVLVAASGEEGIAVFEAERPPIVVTDIKMPQMDGIEVLKRIKAAAPETEVIVITGHGDIDLAIEALNLDAADFINKPIQRRALEQALKRAEERQRTIAGKEEEIQIHDRQTAAVIAVRGVLNAASEERVQMAYRQACDLNRRRVVVSFHESASINGAGLAILAQLLLDARKKDRQVLVVAPSLNFRRVFEIVGISRLAPIFDAEGEALPNDTE